MENFWQDLRFSLAALRRRRGATAILLISLALGIGMVSAVFSVVDAVLLQGLPYRDADRLVEVSGVRHRNGTVETWPLSYLDFGDWSERARGSVLLGAYSDPTSFTLEAGGRAEHLDGELASAGYFQALGVVPILGRAFSAAEDATQDPRYVVVLGHDLWRERFGGDRQAVGRSIRLGGASYQVVGVMPPGFRGATDSAQVWLPLNMASQVLGPIYIHGRGLRWLTAVGRLRPGVTAAGAQAALDAVAAALEKEYPRSNKGVGARVTPLQEAWTGNLRRTLLLLLAGAALVLLMACANVASLLLTQAMERRQEISVRTALGATRRRLARQLLTESLLLSLLGCALGLLLGLAATHLLDVVRAAGLRSYVHVGLDARAAAFTVGVSLLCGAGFGLAPLWAAWRTDVAGVLKEGTRGSPRQRLQSVLVAGEVALALALLVAAGLTVRGFQKLQGTRLGYRTDVLTLRLDIGGKAYADENAVLQLLRRLDERIGALPGVHAVAFEGPGLPTVSSDEAGFTVADRLDPAEDAAFSLFMHHVSPAYFSTLGVPLLQGRGFAERDDKQAQPWSVVVGAATARRLWPGRSALGKRMKIGSRDGRFPWFAVIGVVGDARHQGLATDENQWRQEPRDVYFTALQFPPSSEVNVLVRPGPGTDALALAEPVRRVVAAVDPGLAVFDAATLAQRLAGQTARPRLLVRLMALFSLLALVLAAVGIHGIVANSVARRTREIGIRIALGADRGVVVGWIVRRAALLALAGIAGGLGAAAILSRLLESHLYGIPALDPPAFAVASLLLLAIAMLTSYAAARRASRIQPTAALRVE